MPSETRIVAKITLKSGSLDAGGEAASFAVADKALEKSVRLARLAIIVVRTLFDLALLYELLATGAFGPTTDYSGKVQTQ